MTTGWRQGVLRGDGRPAAGRGLVVKLGGSLLTRHDWTHEVPRLLGSLTGPCLVVVGGGPLVDGLREIDRAAPAPAAVVHRVAIDCMAVTARVVAAALAVPLVVDHDAEAVAVLDPPAWLEREDRLARLPVGWQVTSDSIAAVVAAESGRGLLLVKSVPPPEQDLLAIAAAGWVDAWFPTAARPVATIGWAAPG